MPSFSNPIISKNSASDYPWTYSNYSMPRSVPEGVSSAGFYVAFFRMRRGFSFGIARRLEVSAAVSGYQSIAQEEADMVDVD